MTALWTLDEITAATRGHTFGPVAAQCAITGISIDSRTIKPGDLFVALSGPGLARDGHDFVDQAFAAGAAVALVSKKPVLASSPNTVIQVGDTQQALELLGQAARQRTQAKVIGVTGSVGKTGTKEALAHVLAAQGMTHASAASYNNLWGVPLSLARMPSQTQFGIFEIGMNHAGEIRPLTKQVAPDVALVTTVAPVHLEFFDSVESIADAKAEIFEGLQGGTAVLNRDNAYFARLKTAAERCHTGAILTFGEGAQADIRLLDYAEEADGAHIRVAFGAKIMSGRIGIAGRHIAQNCLGVLACVHAAGADVESAFQDLSNLSAGDGRGRQHEIFYKNGALKLIDESYNASPISIRAALKVLRADKTSMRRVAVLGDMRELGAQSESLHVDLADDVAASTDIVFACGPFMRRLFDALPESKRGAWADDSTKLAPAVSDAVRAGDVVMVKGSNGSAMGVIVRQLLAQAGA